jgi:hypothetical protein
VILTSDAPAPLLAPSPPSPSAPVVRLVETPVQLAGTPTRLRRVEYGGPVVGADVRLLMDRHLLRSLLAVAEGTPTGRAQIDGAALLIETRVGGDRHPYEVWTLLSGRPPRPEPGPFSANAGPEAPYDDDATDPLGRPPVIAQAGVVGRHLYGTPADPAVRMYLDAATLRSFLRKAEDALSGRVQLDHVGLVVEEYDDEGRRFAVWSLTCAAPRPEPDRITTR